jgi:hypothetical protein
MMHPVVARRIIKPVTDRILDMTELFNFMEQDYPVVAAFSMGCNPTTRSLYV